MSKLDLKYRPRKLSEVLGNSGVKRLLLTRSREGSLSDQSMMFGGPKGCGKTTMARIVARAMFCSDLDDGEPCGECEICTTILADACPSVEEMDAASQGTVDKIRAMVAESDYGTIDGSDNMVYIIDEAQRLSKAAQDALLKAVEGRFFTVILCTTEPQNIKGPIRNRVEEYPVHPPSEEDLVSHLTTICGKESIQFEPAGIELIVKMNGRTPRSCLLSLSSISATGPISDSLVREYFRFDSYSLVDRVLCLLDQDPVSAFSSLDDLSSRESPTWIRDAMVLAVSSGLRTDVGARPTYPIQSNFFPIRGRKWLQLAQDLGRLDRPSIADIESSLLNDPSAQGFIAPPVVKSSPEATVIVSAPPAPSAPAVPPATAPAATPATAPAAVVATTSPAAVPISSPAQKPAGLSKKEIEIDGVTYSSEENLTTLDKKILSVEPENLPVDRESVSVGLDDSRAPITEKEFVSGVLTRLKGPR